MTNLINESVSVNFLSNHLKHTAYPMSFDWNGRHYQIKKIGLHHTVREGKTLIHVFSVTDDNNFFRLQLNTETLNWKLIEVDNGI